MRRNGSLVRRYQKSFAKGQTSWMCKACGDTKPLTEEFFPRSKSRKSGFHPQCKVCSNSSTSASTRRLKLEMIFAYGGRCSCCGESEEQFLTLEHKNHDGVAHRRTNNFGGVGVWRDLKRRGWPKDAYTIFCWNCNLATKNGDPCPHEVARKFRVVK